MMLYGIHLDWGYIFHWSPSTSKTSWSLWSRSPTSTWHPRLSCPLHSQRATTVQSEFPLCLTGSVHGAVHLRPGWKQITADTDNTQGVYKFNQANFLEIPGGILRKIQDMFALLRLPM